MELLTIQNAFYLIVYLILVSLIIGVVYTLWKIRLIEQEAHRDRVERLISDITDVSDALESQINGETSL